MDPLLVDILGVAARWALTLVVGWLVAHHALPADQGSSVIAHYLPLLTGKLALGVGMAGPLLWGLRQKIVARRHLNTALEMPKGTTVAEVTAVVKQGEGASALISTVLLVAALAGGAVATSACAPKTWQPQTQTAFNQKSVVEGLADLQHVAIGLGEADVIPLRDSGFVVAGVQSLLDGLDAGGAGWPDTVRATLLSFIGDPAATPKPIPPRLSGISIDQLAPRIRTLLPLLDLVEVRR